MRRERSDPRRWDGIAALRLALIAGSCAAIAYGVACGEWMAVMAKGVRICLECIGIA